jgi:hypothetical protein
MILQSMVGHILRPVGNRRSFVELWVVKINAVSGSQATDGLLTKLGTMWATTMPLWHGGISKGQQCLEMYLTGLLECAWFQDHKATGIAFLQ